MKTGEKIKVFVNAEEKYSAEPKISVNLGEVYEILVDKNQVWKDWVVETTPDGFCNPLLLLSGRRVEGVKCFCLCGTINKNEEHHFKIGSGIHHFTMAHTGDLFFFANDSFKHYCNNSGTICLEIRLIS